MPGLPSANSSWPENDMQLAFAQYERNDAWISDDQIKLQAVYASAGTASTRGDNEATHYNKGDGTKRRGGLRGIASRMFNGRIIHTAGQQTTRIHAPVASNLATLSADLLMAEPPTFRLLDGKGQALKGKVSDRLDDIMNGADTHRTLHNAAELAAGLSAVVLTAHWDKSVSDKPWIQETACDAAVPEFVGNRLVAVNLYTMHVADRNAAVVEDVFVHIERHEIGRIIHALYKTKIDAVSETMGALGEIIPLDTIPATAHIAKISGSVAGDVDNTIALPTGISRLTAAWWRNLPTKTFRKYGALKMLGRADFEGVEQLLDAVDEVWSSWMRDIKVARARLIVPEQFLELQGAGMGGAFDDDQEVLTGLAFTDLGPDQGKITANQFAIRATEHAATLLALTKEITQYAGYSLSSYGERSEMGNVTATETVDRTTMTERTRDKKFLYFEEAAAPLTMAIMELDAVHYGGQKIPADATLDIQITELSQIDPEKEARVFQYLRAAMAASTSTLVRAQHPDWEEKELLAEIRRIQAENNLTEELDAGVVDRVDPNAPEVDDEGNPIIPGTETVEDEAA